MPRKKMWMGTRGYEMWVPCPAINMGQSQVGFGSQLQYLDGGTGVRNSVASHAEYDMSWNPGKRDDMRPILDMAAGVYDTDDGVNLVYFVSPMASRKNLAPGHIGTPSQAGSDGMPIFVNQAPVLVPTPANTLGYPARSAQYTAQANSLKTYFPVPPGYQLWVGVHGSATGSAFARVTPFVGVSPVTATLLTLLSTSDTNRVNASFASSAGYTGIELDFGIAGVYPLVNYSTNPSMEVSTAGYTATAVPGDTLTLTRETTGGGFGGSAAYLRLTATSVVLPSPIGVRYTVPIPKTIKTGTPVSSGIRIRSSVATDYYITGDWYDDNGNPVGYWGSANYTVPVGGTWAASTQMKIENKLKPAKATSIQFYVAPTTGISTGAYFELDAAITNLGTTLNAFADGSSAGWYWNGVPGLSSSAQANGGITLSGIIVQCLPEGETPETGGFISGQGNSGCQFVGKPAQTAYSAALDRLGVTAKLVETGAWL